MGCGDISGGLVAFDWDFRKGFNRKTEGFPIIFKEYKEKLGKLAITLIIETPNGYHFYYKLKGEKYRNTKQENGGFSKTLKTFTSSNEVRFGQWLKGLDTRANGGYVVMPPSKVKEGSYKWLTEREPLEITDKDYESIIDFFKEKDIAGYTMRMKFVDIIKGKLDPHDLKSKKNPEHVYWKEMYHEAWKCCGLRPDDLLKGLAKHQKGFNLEKTQIQLKDQKNLDYIYSISRLGKAKYEKYFLIKKEGSLEDIFGDVNEEDILELKGRGNIIPRNDGLYLEKVYKKSVEYIQVLEGCLRLEKLAYDTMNNNRLLVSGIHDSKSFRTIPMDVLLNSLGDYMYQGNVGKDIVKKYIHSLKNELEIYELNYVLGFNSHWNLPCLEEIIKFQIITSTDKQIEAYKKCEKLPIVYKDWEKKVIKRLLKRFIKCTQINKSKLSIIIGWAMAAPFRHIFIEYLDLFTILCAYGPRNTGKTAILKYYCLDFYGIHLPYNSSILYSLSRFEDLLSTGSFPVFVEEIITIPLEVLSLIKEHATMSTNFFRKKNARENDFDCLKSAPLVFDCNKEVKSLMDPATNSKLTLIPFSEKEKIGIDSEWTNLRRILKSYNLFSLVFEHTKDWTQDTLGLKISQYLKVNPITNEDEENNPRLKQQWIIIKFGLDLFEEVFGIELESDNFLDILRYGRTMMTQSLLNDFYNFCEEARNYDINNEDAKYPKYLNHELEYYKTRAKGSGYFFKSTNKFDFQNISREKYTLEDLCEKLKDALQDKHKHLISNHNTGKNRGIFIKEAFFSLPIFKEKKKKELMSSNG